MGKNKSWNLKRKKKKKKTHIWTQQVKVGSRNPIWRHSSAEHLPDEWISAPAVQNPEHLCCKYLHSWKDLCSGTHCCRSTDINIPVSQRLSKTSSFKITEAGTNDLHNFWKPGFHLSPLQKISLMSGVPSHSEIMEHTTSCSSRPWGPRKKPVSSSQA